MPMTACVRSEEGGYGPAPQRLDLGSLNRLAETAFALGFEPELVDVTAVIALHIPQIAILARARTIFETVPLDP